jgi:hypothetical protein
MTIGDRFLCCEHSIKAGKHAKKVLYGVLLKVKVQVKNGFLLKLNLNLSLKTLMGAHIRPFSFISRTINSL